MNLKIACRKIFFEKTDKTFIQLFRYTIVGGLAFFADFGLLFIFTEFLKLHYLLSGALSFSVGLLVNYFLSKKWVFNRKKLNNLFLEFFIFAVIGIIGLGINEIALWFFTEKIHFYYLFSKIAAAIFVYLWNFTARKITLF
jgi:putative flippase GtrA